MDVVSSRDLELYFSDSKNVLYEPNCMSMVVQSAVVQSTQQDCMDTAEIRICLVFSVSIYSFFEKNRLMYYSIFSWNHKTVCDENERCYCFLVFLCVFFPSQMVNCFSSPLYAQQQQKSSH